MSHVAASVRIDDARASSPNATGSTSITRSSWHGLASRLPNAPKMPRV